MEHNEPPKGKTWVKVLAVILAVVLVIGGLGAAVCEYLSQACPVPVVRHGVEDCFGRSGPAKKVLAAYGLTAEGLAEKVRLAVSLKNR